MASADLGQPEEGRSITTTLSPKLIARVPLVCDGSEAAALGSARP
jgi:hypothetical protein